MQFDSISSLPLLIQERADMDEHVDLNIALVEQFKLTSEQEAAFLLVVNDILTRQATVEALPTLLAQQLGIVAQTAEKIAVELWGNYFLLFQDFLTPVGSNFSVIPSTARNLHDQSTQNAEPSTALRSVRDDKGSSEDGKGGMGQRVDELIPQHGGNLPAFQERARRLLSPARQLRDYMREFLSDTPLEKATDVCAGEIAEALVARVLGGKRDTFLSAVQMAITKENLPVEQAEKLVNNFEGMIAAGTITKEWAQYYRELAENVLQGVAFAEPSPSVIPSTARNLPAQSNQNADASTALRSARDDKVATLQATSYKLQAGSLPSREEYDHIAGVIVAEAKDLLSDPALSSRLRQILVTRLKNIRSIIETREKLVSSPAVGGIGLSGDEADALTRKTTDIAEKILNGEYEIPKASASATPDIPSPFDSPPSSGSLRAGSATNLPVQASQNADPSTSLGMTQREPRDNKEGGADVAVIASTATNLPIQASQNADPSTALRGVYPERVERVRDDRPALAIEEIDGLPVIVQKQNATAVIPSTARNLQDQSSQNADPSTALRGVYPERFERARDDKKNRNDIPAVPPTPSALQDGKPIPVIIRPPGSATAQPKVAEVKRPPAKLVDAVEELRIMTLKDFRRLSQDPQEAIRSVQQKVQSLEKQSITKKMAAIDAWKENAVSVLYREMAGESMTAGGRMDTVIAQRASAGKDALTEAEFDALLDLNELLRT